MPSVSRQDVIWRGLIFHELNCVASILILGAKKTSQPFSRGRWLEDGSSSCGEATPFRVAFESECVEQGGLAGHD